MATMGVETGGSTDWLGLRQRAIDRYWYQLWRSSVWFPGDVVCVGPFCLHDLRAET